MSEQVRLRKKQFEKICRKVGRAILEYGLIEAGDRVLVGLSGGKDSMILLEALAERKKHFPFDFEIFAVHVTAKGVGYEMDTAYLEQFCKDLEVELHLEEIEVDLSVDSKKAPCFICSWNRRKELFTLTRELNCNKLALGHHRNDAIETLLMNMIYHGSISSLPYSLKMFEGRIQLIRPMMDLDERMLEEYAGLNNLVKVEKSCPHGDSTQRENIAQLLKQVENLHGKGPFNIFKSMDKRNRSYIQQFCFCQIRT